ncbi:la 1 [Olea europaea subsp. europaea]|uniref:La 1 n=2 Tax=Olea europaea subsp. europaea TaxID=158383 RepID=A0A8S0VGS1_OLEEU|nr:la 1 [Olea europaea subsp. europaea]
MAKPTLDEETAKKVIRQVEFYFSDSNLPRDKFLRNTINESDDGMVSLALICSFSRMRGHLGLGDAKPEDVSEDTVKAVAETLRTSTFLKVSDDGKKVGRVTELAKPEEVIEQSDVRTIAASPLEYDVKLEDVELFFNKYAKVNSVRLPRHVADKRLFSGTALIEFSTEEDAANVLKQILSYAGVELELKPKKDFDDERAKQEEEVEKTRSQVGSNRNNKANARPDYPEGLIVAFKLKRNSSGGSEEQNGTVAPVNNIGGAPKTDGEQDTPQNITEETEQNVSGDVDEGNDKDNVEENEENEEDTTGAENEVQESKGLGEEKSTIADYKDNKDVVLREDLKSIFQKFGTVKFIDFKIGSDSGYVRFEDAGTAQKARAAAVLAEEGGLIVKNFVATLDPVTGDAEREYWNLLRTNQEKHRDNFKSNRGRGGKHNRGGKHFRGKHSRSSDSGSRPNKVQKIAA